MLAEVEHQPPGGGGLSCQPDSAGQIPHVAAGGQPGSGANRDPGSPGANTAQDGLLAPLGIALAVDHGQPDNGGPARQIEVLRVELVVISLPAAALAVRVALGTYRRILIQRHRIGLLPPEKGAEGSVDIHRRDDHQPGVRGNHIEHRLRVLSGHRSHVDQGLGPRHRGDAGQLIAGEVDVCAGGEIGRLGLSSVNHRHVMARRDELFDQRESDETSPSQHRDPHGVESLGNRFGWAPGPAHALQ